MYRVYIEGKGNPKQEHKSYDEAVLELDRLLMLTENCNRVGYVFRVEMIKKSCIVVKEIGDCNV